MEVSTCPSAASTSLKREPTMSRKVFCAGSCTCASTNRQFAAANNRPVEVEREGESQPGHGGGLLRRLTRARAHNKLVCAPRRVPASTLQCCTRISASRLSSSAPHTCTLWGCCLAGQQRCVFQGRLPAYAFRRREEERECLRERVCVKWFFDTHQRQPSPIRVRFPPLLLLLLLPLLLRSAGRRWRPDSFRLQRGLGCRHRRSNC